MESKLLTEEVKDVKDENNVIDIASRARLKPAGADPNDPIWLKHLGIGSIFLARKKQVAEFVLGMFCIEGKTERAVFLLEQSMGDKSIAIDPVRFCNQYELFELLRDHETFLAELEVNKKLDEQRNQSEQSSVENPQGSES